MAKPKSVGIGDWNQMVETFHNESDRGAAILAGSFAEHALGTYLIHKVSDKNIGEKLFGPVGPLSSFSQRIAVAYAFSLISKDQYEELEAIRQARNHFAHHPLEASFSSQEVQKHTAKLAIFRAIDLLDSAEKHRRAYLLGCGLICARLLDQIGIDVTKKEPSL